MPTPPYSRLCPLDYLFYLLRMMRNRGVKLPKWQNEEIHMKYEDTSWLQVFGHTPRKMTGGLLCQFGRNLPCR